MNEISPISLFKSEKINVLILIHSQEYTLVLKPYSSILWNKVSRETAHS